MGYGRGDYEAAKEVKVKNDPNAHVGGPGWVNENEGYDSWKKDNKKTRAVVQQ